MKRTFIIIINVLLLLVVSNCGGLETPKNTPKEKEEQQAGEGVPQDFTHKGPNAVFIGNSITRLWSQDGAGFFAKNNYVGRGIDGQTSNTIKNRFDNDVLAQDPWCVVISCGTNDAARNDGAYVPVSTVMANIATMVQKAKAAHIKVLLASVTPCCAFWWDENLTEIDIKPYIKELNAEIAAYAEANNCIYVDYYSVMKNSSDCAPDTYFYDGVHPNTDGFAVMAAVVKPLLDKALGK
jgi:lysophospholipase L1-like esterase